VADPEVDPAMSRRGVSSVALVLLLALPALFVGVGALAAPARAAGTTPVAGSITGPTVVSTTSNNTFLISGYGGPAFNSEGVLVGNVTYYATPTGPNLTGVSLQPSTSNIVGNQSVAAKLYTGNATETLVIDVEVSSVFNGHNQSTNFTYTVTVVAPYVVSATIVNPSNVTVSGFTVWVTLDGAVIGSVNVSRLAAGASERVTFRYPTLGLSSGTHTFALSLVQEHGLVTFANGQTVYTATVYITGPAPSYTLWYIAGIVAFFGAIFIFASRVAARRRGTARR
jgi:hypothetical protein